MTKGKIVVLLFLITLTAKGQVINNLSSDKSNIYFHALDSVTKILKKNCVLSVVTVSGDNSITRNFSDMVDGIKLVRLAEDRKKLPKIKKGEARLVIKNIQIIKDEFKVTILTWGHESRLGDGLYVFRYKYIPETMIYELEEIKSGSLL
jgi:hypothetical protein